MKLGSYIHAYYEMIYRLILSRYNGVPQVLDPHDVDFAFGRVQVEEGDAALSARAMALAAHYNRQIPRLDKNLRIAGIELWLQVPFQTPAGHWIVLEGYIDLLVWDESRDKVELLNVDHKSSGRAWTADEAELDSQLQMYQLMLEATGRPVAGSIINNVVTYNYTDLSQAIREGKVYHRLRQRKKPAQIQNYAEEIGRFIDRLLDQTHYPKRWGKDCVRCPFMPVCDARLKGDDREAKLYLETQFIDKDLVRRVQRGMDLPPQVPETPASFTVVKRRNKVPASDWI